MLGQSLRVLDLGLRGLQLLVEELALTLLHVGKLFEKLAHFRGRLVGRILGRIPLLAKELLVALCLGQRSRPLALNEGIRQGIASVLRGDGIGVGNLDIEARLPLPVVLDSLGKFQKEILVVLRSTGREPLD